MRGGLLGNARLRMVVEEHGGGKQLVRFRTWPKYSATGVCLTLLLAVLAFGAAGLVILAIFTLVELRTAEPMIDMRLFQNRLLHGPIAALQEASREGHSGSLREALMKLFGLK